MLRGTILSSATTSDDVVASVHAKHWVEEAGDLRVADVSRVRAGTRHTSSIA
jgi:hypothetical protein